MAASSNIEFIFDRKHLAKTGRGSLSKVGRDADCAKTVLNQSSCQFSSTGLSLKGLVIISPAITSTIIKHYFVLFYIWARPQSVFMRSVWKKKFKLFAKTTTIRNTFIYSLITTNSQQANLASVSLDLQMHFSEIISQEKVSTEVGGYTPQNL